MGFQRNWHLNFQHQVKSSYLNFYFEFDVNLKLRAQLNWAFHQKLFIFRVRFTKSIVGYDFGHSNLIQLFLFALNLNHSTTFRWINICTLHLKSETAIKPQYLVNYAHQSPYLVTHNNLLYDEMIKYSDLVDLNVYFIGITTKFSESVVRLLVKQHNSFI